MSINIEIKARCQNPEKIKTILLEQDAQFKGIDHQIDTYFKVNNGRLKLREGTIENNLIFYTRPNQEGPKRSDFMLYPSKPDSCLKAILREANEILAVVDKQRAIYYIDNVKFQVDEVQSLGTFVEIEANDENGMYGEEELQKQCQYYMQLFGIKDEDLVNVSYSDLILRQSA